MHPDLEFARKLDETIPEGIEIILDLRKIGNHPFTHLDYILFREKDDFYALAERTYVVKAAGTHARINPPPVREIANKVILDSLSELVWTGTRQARPWQEAGLKNRFGRSTCLVRTNP